MMKSNGLKYFILGGVSMLTGSFFKHLTLTSMPRRWTHEWDHVLKHYLRQKTTHVVSGRTEQG